MESDEQSIVVVLITTPPDQASRMAHHLVDNRLAACVNIIPDIRSVYRWQENVEEDLECLLLVKTTKLAYEALAAAVRELHPYSVPEIIALPLIDGFDSYLRWVRESVGPATAAE